jgi:hypothetical protein
MKILFIAIMLCLLLGCGSRQQTQNGTGPSLIMLYEGGKIVGIWKAFDVARLSPNQVEFINEAGMQYMIISGTYIVKPLREAEPGYIYTHQKI